MVDFTMAKYRDFIVLYTLSMNINGYVPFLINTLDTTLSGVKIY